MLKATLERLSIAHRTAMGVELVFQPGQPRDPSKSKPHLEFALDLSALSIAEALNKISGYKVEGPIASYTWSSDAGIVHFRPLSFVNNRDTVLNHVVSTFDCSTSNILEALYRVLSEWKSVGNAGPGPSSG